MSTVIFAVRLIFCLGFETTDTVPHAIINALKTTTSEASEKSLFVITSIGARRQLQALTSANINEAISRGILSSRRLWKVYGLGSSSKGLERGGVRGEELCGECLYSYFPSQCG